MAPPRLDDLPNELLHDIMECIPVDSISEFAALAQMNRHFNIIATPYLYAAAALDEKLSHLILSIAAESDITTRSMRPARLLLKKGGNPNPVRGFPIIRNDLNSVLAAQGRAPGRKPLIDLNFRLECGKVFGYCPLKPYSENQFNLPQDDALALAMCHDGTIIDHMGEDPFQAEPRPRSWMRAPLTGWFWSPLHIAAHRGDNELIALLLLHGEAHVNDFARGCCAGPAIPNGNDLNAKALFRPWWRSKPHTPLECAIYAGHISTARLLIDHEASPEISRGLSVDAQHIGTRPSALQLAAWHGSLELCRFLVEEEGFDVNFMPNPWLSPLSYSVLSGHSQSVGRYLLEKGADMSLPLSEASIVKENIFTFCLSPAWSTRLVDVSLLLDVNPGIILDAPTRARTIQCCVVFRDKSEEFPGERGGELGRHSLPLWGLQPFPCSDQGLDLLHCDDYSKFFERMRKERDDIIAPEVRQAETLKILLRLLSMDPTLGATITGDTIQTAIRELARPEIVGLLLESADTDQVTGEHFWRFLETALSDHHVSCAVIKVLLDYGRAKGQFPPPNLNTGGDQPNPGDLISHHLSLANIETVEERIEVTRLIHDYFGNGNHDNGPLTGPALVRGLRDACASSLPGTLEVCKILHSLGASKFVQVDDFVAMIHGAAHSHDPTPLLEWVMSIASATGQKDDLINAFQAQIKPLIYSINRCKGLLSAKWLLDQGVQFPPEPEPKTHPRGSFFLDDRDSMMQFLCLRSFIDPDAPRLMERIFEAVPREWAVVLANYGQQEAELTPASRLLNLSSPTTRSDRRQDEATRLRDQKVIRLLLANGAQIHMDDGRQYNWDEEFPPGEPISYDPGYDNINPIGKAIRFQRWDLVDIMLTARPLPNRNSRHGIIYLQQAVTCLTELWNWVAPSPDNLAVVLKHIKLDSMDLPLPGDEKPALYVLLEAFSSNFPFIEYFHDTDENHHEECKCSEEIKLRKDHLSRCVYLLLKHGAQWTAKCPGSGETPLDFIKAQRKERRYCFVPFTRHNWDELENHLVLDWEEYGDAIPEGFNPFEMNDIKATRGGSAPVNIPSGSP